MEQVRPLNVRRATVTIAGGLTAQRVLLLIRVLVVIQRVFGEVVRRVEGPRSVDTRLEVYVR